ncbi:uncharacterized protein LOC129596488 [Paramacrobiotus metropolitanus]|uniref:uncharacterized protein LOC129596488 n=1 Tax=Paramacrobiotus metropolitanus TaxID=2943436 RepID=UPI002445F99B|nr:uncharacterized protein LOC129596488 [Paramacrobiotus metropolitanus]
MGTGSQFFIILGLGFLSCICNVNAQYYRYYTDLEKTCNQSVELECPFSFTGRAGTFHYDYISDLSPGLCYFNVTLPPDCGASSDFFAVYFNIRKFLLPSTDRFRIYQTNRLAPRILLKELNGSHSARSNPASVAQALTSYVKQPSFTFEYFRGTSPSTESHQANIDFIIVDKSTDVLSASCTALSGFVDDYFICHTDGINDRVNCPDSFTADVYAVNPALKRQTCIFKSQPSFANHQPIDDYLNAQDAPGLSSGAIAGIVCGCVLFVAIIVTAVFMVRSARRRTLPSLPIVLPSTSGDVQLEPLLAVPPDATSWQAVLDDAVQDQQHVASPPPILEVPPSHSQANTAPVAITLSNPPSDT